MNTAPVAAESTAGLASVCSLDCPLLLSSALSCGQTYICIFIAETSFPGDVVVEEAGCPAWMM